jgi:hypothetical protein
MGKIKYTIKNGELQYECFFSNVNEKHKQSLITVPYSWSIENKDKKLKVIISVID